MQYSFVESEEQVTPAASTNGSAVTGSYATQMNYTFWSSGADLMPKKIVTTNPTVTTANNGSNAATSREVYLRKDGTAAFTQA